MLFKQLNRRLPAFIQALVLIFLLEFALLGLGRIVFYFFLKTPDVSRVPAGQVIEAFLVGMEFDMVISTYALFLPLILLLLSAFFHKRTSFFHKAAFTTVFIIYLLFALVSAADFPFFAQFKSHLNKQAFLWADSPTFVLKLIFGSVSYYGYLLVFLLYAYVIYRVLKYIAALTWKWQQQNQESLLKVSAGFILLLPFVVLGARGRISGKSTTHEGLAIVGDNLFVNQVALNPNFTLFRSLFFQKVKEYKVPEDIDESIAYARNFFGIKAPYERSIRRIQKADSAFRTMNVVIVCMESLSAYKTGIHGRENLMPRLTELIKQSLMFDNFYSSGIHTFNGLFSTCASYPNMLTEQSLRRYTKKPFTTLGNLLENKKYKTFFFSTHDPYFDNMQGFFTLNGYQHTFSSFDLPAEKSISATGVPDHELYELVIEKMNETGNNPFLAFIMTGSDHGPWAIPEGIPFKPSADAENKRSTQYADWALGKFIDDAKQQKWYNNTLFVILGDHGYATDGCYEMPLSYHHIPLVLHQPSLFAPDTIHSAGYQPDVTATIAGALNLEFENNTFGINLLKEKHPFVFFTADDKTGCIDNDGYFFYELLSQNTVRLRKHRYLDQEDYYSRCKSKADSMQTGIKKMLDAAGYFIRQEYFTY